MPSHSLSLCTHISCQWLDRCLYLLQSENSKLSKIKHNVQDSGTLYGCVNADIKAKAASITYSNTYCIQSLFDLRSHCASHGAHDSDANCTHSTFAAWQKGSTYISNKCWEGILVPKWSWRLKLTMVLGSVDRCCGRNSEVVSVMNPDDVAENISRNIIRRDCCATWPLDDVNQHIIDNVLLQHKYSSSCLSSCLSSEFILEQINGASYGDCPEVEISNFPLNSLWSKWSRSRHHDLNLVAFFLFLSFSALLHVFHLSLFASKCMRARHESGTCIVEFDRYRLVDQSHEDVSHSGRSCLSLWIHLKIKTKLMSTLH